MVYTKNETDYECIYEELKSTKITSVIEYFEKKKNEWVIYFHLKYMTLGI